MTYIDDQNTRNSNLKYIQSAMDSKLLGKEEELALAHKWKDEGDTKAMHTLINAYRKLVISSASKYKNYGLPIADLIQEGNIGLMQAINRFEPEREYRFSTYAMWWIRAAIQDYILRNWSIVRTGTTAAQKSLFFNFRRLRAKIDANSKDSKNVLNDNERKQIADELDVNIRDVESMEGRLSGNDHSLNATIKDDSVDEWQNMLEDDRPNPEEVVIGMRDAESRSKWLSDALNKLNTREQKIIRERHLGEQTVTLETLGKDLGISKERVRQLESRAMEKLKSDIAHHMREPANTSNQYTKIS